MKARTESWTRGRLAAGGNWLPVTSEEPGTQHAKGCVKKRKNTMRAGTKVRTLAAPHHVEHVPRQRPALGTEDRIEHCTLVVVCVLKRV